MRNKFSGRQIAVIGNGCFDKMLLTQPDYVLFDGCCGFCTLSIATIRRFDTQDRFEFIPHQVISDEEVTRSGFSRKDCTETVCAKVNGELYRGADAFNAYFAAVGRFRWLLKVVASSRILLSIERNLYLWIARHRKAVSAVMRTRRFALFQEPEHRH